MELRYAKGKDTTTAKATPEGAGDVWTWTAIDTDTKLVPFWYVSNRDTEAARHFISNLAPCLANRVQLTSDEHRPYLDSVEEAFGADIGYAMLVKIYGDVPGQRRYSPGECKGIQMRRVEGRPDPEHISTFFAKCQNLSMRMGMRRFTRLASAFRRSKTTHMRSRFISCTTTLSVFTKLCAVRLQWQLV